MDRFRLSTVVSHVDWAAQFGNWGKVGVESIIDKCVRAGITRIYWRAFGGGLAMYQSRLEQAWHHSDVDRFRHKVDYDALLWEGARSQWGKPQPRTTVFDYRTWDPLDLAVHYCRERGVELIVWYTLNEEDHGYIGLLSSFARAHPEYAWIARDGTVRFTNVSFGFPEVRRHKLAIVRELLDYGVDGLMLDFIRRAGRLRVLGERMVHFPYYWYDEGECQYGYEGPIDEAFRSETGLDPYALPNRDERWIRRRAAYNTLMLREIRQECKDQPKFDLSVLVFPPAVLDAEGKMYAYGDGLNNSALNTPPGLDNNLRAALIDVEGWAREKLVNGISPMISPHYTTTGTWRSRPEAIVPEGSELRRQIGNEVELRAGVYCYNTDAEHMEAMFRQAAELGTQELILFETTPLQMSGHAMGGGMWAKLAELGAQYCCVV
ncbi:MAG: hypothetical protein ACM30E_07430 [Nitrososphaerales archaeon]